MQTQPAADAIPIHSRAERILAKHGSHEAFKGQTGEQRALDLEALTRSGCYFVLCHPDKAASQKGWNDLGTRRADFHAARWLVKEPDPKHTPEETPGAPNLIGCIASSLDHVVVDVDRGGTKACVNVLRRLGIESAALVASQTKGRYHLWIPCSNSVEIGNKAWELDGGGGDIRSNRAGYIVMWRLGQPDAVRTLRIDEEGKPRFSKGMTWSAWTSGINQRDAARTLNLKLLPKKKKESLTPVAVGSRNNELNERVFLGARNGREEDIEAAIRQAERSGLPTAEIARTVASAKAAGEMARRADRPLAEGGDVFSDKSSETLQLALTRLGVESRFDIRSQQKQFRGALRDGETSDWTHSDDLLTASLRGRIEKRFRVQTTRGPVPLRFGLDMWQERLHEHCFSNQVDPFLEWVQTRRPWDGKPRIASLLADHFGADGDDPLVRWASTFLFLGPVQRAFRPGHKLDEMPVLVGAQGIGKSALVRSVLPTEYVWEWFNDRLNLAADDKTKAEALQGAALVEISEMMGATRSDLEDLKNFVTSQNDKLRLSYRRDPVTMKRRACLIGTSNDPTPLPNDQSGNRRFVCVELRKGCNVEKLARERREQWWAEALAMYKAGQRAGLPQKLKKAQRKQAERYRRSDEMMEDVVDKIPADEAGYTLTEAAVEARLADTADEAVKLPAVTMRRFSAALRAAGWRKKRGLKGADGARRMRWYAPVG